jgi:predicted AAA+ superfamily ATPase
VDDGVHQDLPQRLLRQLREAFGLHALSEGSVVDIGSRFAVNLLAVFTRELRPASNSFFLFGPRGTGKTTWIRGNVEAKSTYDLLLTSESLRLNRDPAAFGKECEALDTGDWVVVDEIQKAPLLLDEVQRMITEKRLRFVLSGSSARKLRRGASNLLAGRAEVRHLFPFVSKELDFKRGLEETLQHGMLPLAVVGDRPRAFLKSYVETYLHEEVQAEALVRQIGSFARFLEVAARMNGQVVNVSGVARDAGVARQTVQDFFQILADTLLAHWLPAWRFKPAAVDVRHPKLYLFDTGVTRHLAGLGHLPVHPEERGFLLETHLLHEIRAYLHYSELEYPVFYWRMRGGIEVDFIVDTPKGIVAIEVKAADRWQSQFHAGIARLKEERPKLSVRAFGVYTGRRLVEEDGVRVMPWENFLRALWEGEIAG